MDNTEEKDIVLRTEAVNEILSYNPKWILRFGIAIVFILLSVGILLSYFISYPDILTSNITLTTLNPPINLVSKSSGKLIQLFVKNNSKVKAHQVIAVIENTADYKDVLFLSEQSIGMLKQLQFFDTISTMEITDLKVGELTPFFLLLSKSIKDLNTYRKVNQYNRQISLLKKDLVNYRDLLNKYKTQESINMQQLILSETDYNRDKKLYDAKVISTREFEIKKKEYLGMLSGYESSKIMLSNVLIQINTVEKNILQLQIQNYQEDIHVKNEVIQDLKTLISEINKWKQQYIIVSPVDGKISFFNVWSINQNVKLGDELFSVIPKQKQEFIGKCILPAANMGKLSIGQRVNIKLDNYPYNEDGILQARVTNISEVPNKETYAVDVELENGLTTSYNKILTYKEEMKGKADIITKNITVIERVFFNFKKLTERK